MYWRMNIPTALQDAEAEIPVSITEGKEIELADFVA